MQAGQAIGFDETTQGRIGIITTELAGNLVKHAGGGHVILRRAGNGLEIMAIDDGPGMNVLRCLEDGYSTAGSPGTGLGAVKRLAETFEFFSMPDKGSVLVATIGPPPAPSAYEIGAVCLPVTGETLCGDGWSVQETPDGLDVVVSDGIGHGPAAAAATDSVLETFRIRSSLPPAERLETMHLALRATRGAAVLTAHHAPEAGTISCAGIGNVAAQILAGVKSRGLVSMNGILGHQVHKIKAFSYELEPSATVVYHTDGLTTHWSLEDFPGLAGRSASVIAGFLYKTFKRGKDDATVVVVRRR